MLIDHLRDTGGAERVLTGLATHMSPDRCQVVVCTKRSASGRLTRTLDAAGVRHFSLRRESRPDVLAFRQLVSFLRAERIDVLHAHKQGSNAWGAVAGLLGRTPVVVAHEHGSQERGVGHRLYRRLVGGLVTAVVTGSTTDRDRLIHLEHIPAEKVVLIPGAYIPRPGSDDGDFRADLGIAPQAPLIGTIAVLRPEKALTVLIDAFARLMRSFPEARLVICGRGPCRSALSRHAEEVGVSDRVLLPGYRDDVGNVLDAIDVAAISSDREGTSLFALECMAHGTPLVATDVGGPHDILEDGVSGRLVAPRDPGALADAIASVLHDRDRGSALAAAARERLQGLTIDHVAGCFADLYERLMAKAVA
jgi:glycosyltransferase involved in cell wall biosynthesis